MLWTTLKRAGLGFILGIAIGNLLSALSGWPDHIVSDILLERAGSLGAAFLWQTLFSGVLGAVGFGGVSFYDIESWSLLRTVVVHWLIIEAVNIPVAFGLGWIVTAEQTLILAGYQAVTYLIIFAVMWARYRRLVRELNELNEKRKTGRGKPKKRDADTAK